MKLEVDVTLQRRSGFVLDCRFQSEAQSLGVVGPSGSGKSTLLSAMAGIEGGARIVIDGHDLTHAPSHRRHVGYVTQDASLFPHMTIRRNLLYAPGADDAEAVAAALHIEHLLDRMPRNLSGGERRRAALARAIAAKPRFLLLDEPFAGLDERLRRDALSLLHHIRRKFDIPMVLVSHHAEEIIGLADWTIRLENGSITDSGPSEAVMRGAGTRIDNYLIGDNVAPGRFVVQGVELGVAFPSDVPAKGRAACFANDIVLAKHQPAEISARNILPVTIVGATVTPHSVLLVVEPPRLQVIVTPQAVSSLHLGPGQRVFAIIKATAITYLGPP